MNPLERLLREIIAAEGPMSVEAYMALALGHPTLGYYMTRDPFGAGGDFTTSPEISQIFGELIGLWAVDMWMRMGAPSPIRIVELGPGRGALMADFLRAARIAPAFLAAARVTLVETSPLLAARQRAALADAPAPVDWAMRLDEVPPGPALVVANEFFDALPIRQFVRAADGWREVLVGLGPDDRLTRAPAAGRSDGISTAAPVGATLEIPAAGADVAEALGRRLSAQGGCALALDYGAATPGFGDTLQALRHGAPADPLRHPGDADLTAHVDFAALARAASRAGALIDGPIEQSDFLGRLGLAARVQRLTRDASPDAAAAIRAGAARLVDRASPTAMGRLFKVMSLRAPTCPRPAGFEDTQ